MAEIWLDGMCAAVQQPAGTDDVCTCSMLGDEKEEFGKGSAEQYTMRIRRSLISLAAAVVFAVCTVMGAGTAAAAAGGEAVPISDSIPVTEAHGVLVAYFSATGSTAHVAEYIAEKLNAVTFAVEPEEPYTSADLSYTNPDSRVSREHDDPSLRNIALLTTTPENWDSFDIVFVGYPIWWGLAAWPIDTFLQGNDFSGKTIIPFCTSGSSPLGSSAANLHALAPDATWVDGQRFSSAASREQVDIWLDSLEVPAASGEPSAPSTEPALSLRLKDSAPDGVALTRGSDGVLALTGLTAGTEEDYTAVFEVLSWVETDNGGTVRIENADGSDAAGDAPVGTGMRIADVGSDGVTLSRVRIVVMGDVLGTGIVALSQLVQFARALSGAALLEGVYLQAADWSDTGSVTLTDLVREAALLQASAA